MKDYREHLRLMERRARIDRWLVRVAFVLVAVGLGIIIMEALLR